MAIESLRRSVHDEKNMDIGGLLALIFKPPPTTYGPLTY